MILLLAPRGRPRCNTVRPVGRCSCMRRARSEPAFARHDRHGWESRCSQSLQCSFAPHPRHAGMATTHGFYVGGPALPQAVCPRAGKQCVIHRGPCLACSDFCPMKDARTEEVMARYGRKAQTKVEKSMHEMKRGKLRSGRSGKKVTSRKQAIAIGLSEARKEGGKVPAKRSSSRAKSASSRSKSPTSRSGKARSRARKSSGRNR